MHVASIVTEVEQTNGVRQGSPDSPVVFAALTAASLDKALQQHTSKLGEARGPAPPEQGGAYMDDTYLSSHTRLQQSLRELEQELAKHGLAINPKKTAVIYSQHRGEGIHHRRSTSPLPTLRHTHHRPRVPDNIRGRNPIPTLIAEMQRRGRGAFHKHKQTLCARTGLSRRLTAYNTLVRNAAVYTAETWPAHEALLKQANSMQLDHLRQMMHIHRRTGEA